jgi:hypothetical protein
LRGKPYGTGGTYRAAAGGALACGLEVPRDGGRAGLGCEPESGAEEGDKPNRRAPPVSTSGRRKEGGASGFGPGHIAGPRGERGRQGEELGRAGEEGKRGRASWAARGEEKREGKKQEGGPAQERKREREKGMQFKCF